MRWSSAAFPNAKIYHKAVLGVASSDALNAGSAYTDSEIKRMGNTNCRNAP